MNIILHQFGTYTIKIASMFPERLIYLNGIDFNFYVSQKTYHKIQSNPRTRKAVMRRMRLILKKMGHTKPKPPPQTKIYKDESESIDAFHYRWMRLIADRMP